MNVLMTADTVGGVWTYALDLARGLGKHGVAVHLATMGARLSGDQWEGARKIPHLTVHESQFRLEWMDDPWDDVRAAGDWLLGLEREIRPDVVHLNGYAHGSLSWSAPVLICAHSCVLSWWEAVKKEPAPPSWDRYRQAVESGIRAAKLIVAPTHAMLESIRCHYLRPSHGVRTLVIPNGREDGLYASGPKEPVILSAGRIWDEAKNVNALVDIAESLGWPVCVAGEIGDPSKRSEIDLSVRTPRDRGLGDRNPAAPATVAPEQSIAILSRQDWETGGAGVAFLGRLSAEELAGWYARASIYVLPARYEPFGLSILEAAMSGCALAVGDIPSLREVWGDAAVYVDPDDPAHLRRQLINLIENESMRQIIAERARERARRYTVESMATAYYAAYRDLQTEENACT